MALTDEGGSNMVMPVGPMGYGGYGNGGFGGDWSSWIVLFLLFGMFGNGGWGMGGFGGGMLGFDFPWLLNGQNGILNGVNANTNAGFDHLATQNAISGLQSSVISGFGDVQLGIAGVNQAICQTGNGIVQAVNGGFANAETAANARQMANMQQAYSGQIATLQGFNGVQAQNADIKSTILQENCQDRYEAANNARDIITNATANTQALLNSNQKIMDKLCQLELDNARSQVAAEQRENANLRAELMYSRGQASQIDQTAQIRAGQAATANQMISELRSCPIPSQPVYGSQPIFACPNNNSGCGCGNNGFAFA